MVKNMVKVNKFGKMEVSLKELGKIIKHMDLEDLFIRKEIHTKVNGSKIKPMDLESIPIMMEQFIAGNGLKILNKVKGLKLGPMGPHLQDNTLKVKNKDTVSSLGLRVLHIMGSFMLII